MELFANKMFISFVEFTLRTRTSSTTDLDVELWLADVVCPLPFCGGSRTLMLL